MEDKQDHTNNIDRREAIAGGLAAVATMLIAFNPFKSPAKKTDTIKMLSEDGKLVEVDPSMLKGNRKIKISKEELQGWIKEK